MSPEGSAVSDGQGGSGGAALASLALAAFLTPFMGSAVTLALPAMGRDLGLGAVGLGWVASSYLLSAAVILVPVGRLADMIGRRAFFLWGLAVFTAGTILVPLSQGPGPLFALRAVQGLGGAMVFGTGTALLTALFPPGRRGLALGLSVGATYAGLSLGPTAGGVMIAAWGWRSIFWGTAPLGLLAMTLGFSMPRDRGEAAGDGFDLSGSLVYGLGLLALMYGLSRFPETAGLALAGIGLLLLALFVRMEAGMSHPVLDVRLFTENPVFGWSNLAALINYCATAGVGFLLSIYLQQVRGLSPARAGLLLVVQPALMAGLSPLAGSLSDRVQPRALASCGMGLSALGLAFFALLPDRVPLSAIGAGLALLGLGFALFSSPNTNAVMSSVPGRRLGLASATLATMRLVGQMLSLGLVMMALSLALGRSRISPENMHLFIYSFKVMLAGFAVLCALGVPASLARGRIARPGS